MRGAVAPGSLERQHHWVSRVAPQPFVGQRRAGDVTTIETVGFMATTVGYASLGLSFTAALTWRWRAHLWSVDEHAETADRSR